MQYGLEGWTFAQVPIWAICDERISHAQLRLLAYLAWRQGRDNGAWPSLETMARDMGCGVSTIRGHLRGLEKAGYLATEKRKGRTSVYTVMADPMLAAGGTPRRASEAFTPRPRQKPGGVVAKNLAGSPPETWRENDRQERQPGDDKAAAKPPPLHKHPAVQAYRDAAHTYPPKAWYQTVAEAVGDDDANVKMWHATVRAWVGQGWNPRNVDGMLDFWRKGRMPGADKRGGAKVPAAAVDEWLATRQGVAHG